MINEGFRRKKGIFHVTKNDFTFFIFRQPYFSYRWFSSSRLGFLRLVLHFFTVFLRLRTQNEPRYSGGQEFPREITGPLLHPGTLPMSLHFEIRFEGENHQIGGLVLLVMYSSKTRLL